MRKTFKIEDLDCPNCAAKLERAIADIDGVTKVSVSFIAQKMILEADDGAFQDVLKKIPSAAKRAVPDCTVIIP